MRIHIVARKIKMTASIKEFIENRLEKLQDYMDNIVWAQVIVSVEKKLHNAEVILHVGHQTMKAAASTDELYSAIDKVMAKMEAQIKKYKERNTDHRATEAVAADEMSTLIGPEINFTVVKDVPLKPMPGGTPMNVVLPIVKDVARCAIVCGVNINMLMSAFTYRRKLDFDSLTAKIIEDGRKAICEVGSLLAKKPRDAGLL